MNTQKPAAVEARDRTLRYIVAISWIPGFSLLVAHGATTGRVVPALAGIPMSWSVISSLVLLLSKRDRPSFAILSDCFVAAFIFGVLVPDWVELPHSRRSSPGEIALDTYATVPCMLNFCIHLFFILRWVATAISMPRSKSKSTCPHCHGALSIRRFAFHRVAAPAAPTEGCEGSVHSEESYKIRESSEAGSAAEDFVSLEPRPSTDDETAGLFMERTREAAKLDVEEV